MIALSVIVQKGHSLPGDDAEEVSQCAEHFRKCLSKFMNEDGGPYAWAEELAAISGQWNKLVLGHGDALPGSTLSFKDLLEKLPEIMNDSALPAKIYEVRKEEVVEEDPVEEPEPVEEDN